jgi:CMP-N,N'-diacetyllegionaminic acid synthase
MFQGLNVVAFIPARGGSKGLPGKNLMKLEGRSLLRRAIESSQLTGDYEGFADMVVVSSDSQEILEEARNAGVDTVIPHERSMHAATDEATAADVLRDFFEQDDNLDDTRDLWVLYLQPTSPLRTAEHVQQAVDALARTCLLYTSDAADE